jgi:murein DD-endopeptidase MepM/ murein hydrolase activator NlpD
MKNKIKNVIVLQFVLIVSVQNIFSLPTDSLNKVSNSIFCAPAADLYHNTWGGENTRILTNLLDNHANYCLPLQLEGENNFVFPCVNKTYICSPYGTRNGRMHTGMDIKQEHGDSIVAAWDGVVRMAKKNYYAYGGTIVIRHGNGLETLYSHLSSLDVEENQEVKAGDLIGKAGKTGRATTDHLHFETRFLYEHFDPKIIIDFTTFSLSADTLYVSKGKFQAKKPNPSLEIISTENENIVSDSLQIVTTPSVAVSENVTSQKKEITQNNTKQKIHIVQKGDTLYAISKKYNVSIPNLCKLNNLTDETKLDIGQKLKLE